MASVNKVILVGNLGSDPEVRATAGGQCVANFSIATNERWTNKKTGQPEERTEWHKIVVWGRLAELSRDYLSKGRTVYIEGRLQTRKWEDKQGVVKYTTEVVAQVMQFLGSGQGREASHTTTAVGAEESGAPLPQGDSGPPPFGSEEDIPF